MEMEPQIELVGAEIKTIEWNVNIKPMVCVDWDYNIIGGETNV
jgi:hypothetical protein